MITETEKLSTISPNTIITDKKTNISSRVVSTSSKGVVLKPTSKNPPLPEFSKTYDELVEDFYAGDIDISGYEHTDSDKKVLSLITKEMERVYKEEEKIKAKELPIQGYEKGNKIFPANTSIQVIIFSKQKFTTDQAQEWCKENNYKFDKLEETENTYRIRQELASAFRKNSLRTFTLEGGIKSIIGTKK